MISEVALELADAQGRLGGTLHLACLDGKAHWRGIPVIVDHRGNPSWASAAPPVQLLEESEYQYSIELEGDGQVRSLGPSELTSFSNNPSQGRVKTERYTGSITFEIGTDDGTLRGEVEVRSRKIDYETDYQAMLLRIAREAAELVQSSFAANSLRNFSPDVESEPLSLYQRFAFVHALVTSSRVENALHLIERSPHLEHVEEQTIVHPERATRFGKALVRDLTAPGPRFEVDRQVGPLTTLPRSVRSRTHETTFDTTPNRFVRYALERWRSIAQEVSALLEAADSSKASQQRGLREVAEVVDLIEIALARRPLNEAGTLAAFPHSNQVLQGRAGYRDLFEAFFLAESAATINWEAQDRLFSAGQRNVADLYEHWIFLELASLLDHLPGFKVDRRQLISQRDGKLTLELSRTGAAVVTASGMRRRRDIKIDLYFNRKFGHSATGADGTSWTESLRPDCSLRIAGTHSADAVTWIHFDAKYRVANASEIVLDSAEEPDLSPDAPRVEADRPQSSDLMKMHAYRDAIRRTAGAYVLYPGGEGAREARREQYHEILPGLGAFVLRPTSDGTAGESSSKALIAFIEDVVDHVAATGTAAARANFWSREVYSGTKDRARFDHLAEIDRPTQDTSVLLGFVKSEAHLEWCQREGLYNLRADPTRRGAVSLSSPEFAAQLVILYDQASDSVWAFRSTNELFIRRREDLEHSGYPSPTGSQYICVGLDPLDLGVGVSGDQVRALSRQGRARDQWAAPLTLTWHELLGATAES